MNNIIWKIHSRIIEEIVIFVPGADRTHRLFGFMGTVSALTADIILMSAAVASPVKTTFNPNGKKRRILENKSFMLRSRRNSCRFE